MRLALILLALVFGSEAAAQGLRPGPAPAFRGPRPAIYSGANLLLRLPLNAPGCYASGAHLGMKGEPVTVTRSTTATYVDGAGVLQTCAAGSLRVTPQGALIEAAGTNLELYSEQADNAAWAKLGAGTGIAPVVTPNSVSAPDGTTTADAVAFALGAGTTSSDYSILDAPSAGPKSGQYTGSVWLRTTNESTVSVALGIYGLTPTIVTSTPIWQRFTVSSLLANQGAAVRIALRGNQGTSTTANLAVWGAQVETGSVATSYIPTTSTAASRSADVATYTAPASAKLLVQTVSGTRSSAVQAPGTVTLPAGVVKDARVCKVSTLQGDCR